MKNKFVLLLLLLLIIFAGISYGEGFDGNQWLKEKPNNKNSYVKGYIDGANSASGFLPKECKYDKAEFTKHDINYYVKQTNEFYKNYPYFKNILVKDVLLQMSDFLDRNIHEIARTYS